MLNVLIRLPLLYLEFLLMNHLGGKVSVPLFAVVKILAMVLTVMQNVWMIFTAQVPSPTSPIVKCLVLVTLVIIVWNVQMTLIATLVSDVLIPAGVSE